MKKIEMIVYEGEDLKPEVRHIHGSSTPYEDLWIWEFGEIAKMNLTSSWSNGPQDAPICLNIAEKPERVTIYRGLKYPIGLNIISAHHYEDDYQATITDANTRLLQGQRERKCNCAENAPCRISGKCACNLARKLQSKIGDQTE